MGLPAWALGTGHTHRLTLSTQPHRELALALAPLQMGNLGDEMKIFARGHVEAGQRTL